MGSNRQINNRISAPVAEIQVGEDFRFDDTVLQPASDSKDGNSQDVPASQDDTALDALDLFRGTFKGFGFNTIFRPNSSKTPTLLPNPTSDESNNVLLLNLTSESQSFGKPLGDVPNRGLAEQADISLNGRTYTQTITDDMPSSDPEKNPQPEHPVIHHEVGFWMRVPESPKRPGLAASYSRMGSIPHGVTINTQGFQAAVTKCGPPDITPITITPFLTATGRPTPFPSTKASNINTHRLPQDLSPFILQGSITQEILNDPNLILRNANKGKHIVSNAYFAVSTKADPGSFGGGTASIGFLVGSDNDANAADSPPDRKAIANPTKVTAHYWISQVEDFITLHPEHSQSSQRSTNSGNLGHGEQNLVSMEALGPRDAVPTFIVDMKVPKERRVKVRYNQIQYSQSVDLDFAGITWPHVTVGTLVPSRQLLSEVLIS